MGSIILDHVIWPIQQIVHFLSIQFLCDYVYMQTIFAHFFYVCNNEAGGQVRTFFYPPRNCIIGRKFNSIINRKPNRLLVPITLWLANLQILCLQIVWDRQTDRQRKHKSANCYYYCYVVVVIGLGTMHSPKIQYLPIRHSGRAGGHPSNNPTNSRYRSIEMWYNRINYGGGDTIRPSLLTTSNASKAVEWKRGRRRVW